MESERPSEGPESCRGQDRAVLSRERGSCPRLERKWLPAWVGAGLLPMGWVPQARSTGGEGSPQRRWVSDPFGVSFLDGYCYHTEGDMEP